MKIVHLSDSPISLAPLRLCKVQQDAGINARLISFTDHYENEPKLPSDILLEENYFLVSTLLKEAEVIHYHSSWKESKIFQQYPSLWNIVKDKPSVIQYHSFRDKTFEPALREPSLLKLVVAQYHVRFYPECIPVPNIVPIDDSFHSPKWIKNEVPVIAFTPPRCVSKAGNQNNGWANKGCKETLDILKGNYQYKFITGVAWEKVMVGRQSCDISIDEIMTGSYHMCSLESLSQGLATIANLDDLCIDAIEKVTGTRNHPWIVASQETLAEKLNELIEDRAYLNFKRKESRLFMEKYWNVEEVGKRFKNLYQMAQNL